MMTCNISLKDGRVERFCSRVRNRARRPLEVSGGYICKIEIICGFEGPWGTRDLSGMEVAQVG